MLAELKAEMLAALTPEQKSAMATSRLQEQVLGRYGRGELLSEDQVAAIKAMSEEAVQQAEPSVQTDLRAAEELRSRIAKQVHEQVLSEDQRTQIDSREKR